MNPRIIGSVLTVLALVTPRTPVWATINITGRWAVTIDFFGTPVQDVWNIVQVGTSLTKTPPSAGQPGPATGTIDPTSGAFTLSDPAFCHPTIGPESCTFSGTAASNGLAFAGELDCLAPTPTHCGGFGAVSVTAALSGPLTCGNGVVESGEQCDDGTDNGTPGSCCSLACVFVPADTSCGPPTDVCVETDICDGAGHCVGGPPLACDLCSRCDSGSAVCVPNPATSCRAPTVSTAAQLTLRSKTPRLGWKWTKGSATTLADFGDPVHADTYALCIYDESGATPRTLLDATVPSGTSWRAGKSGFTYKDKVGTAHGVMGLSLRAGASGKSRITVSAKGSHLTLPTVPLVLPVAVQLRGHGECWGADFLPGGVKKNTATEFNGKSAP